MYILADIKINCGKSPISNNKENKNVSPSPPLDAPGQQIYIFFKGGGQIYINSLLEIGTSTLNTKFLY